MSVATSLFLFREFEKTVEENILDYKKETDKDKDFNCGGY